jgi:hypothetical protein
MIIIIGIFFDTCEALAKRHEEAGMHGASE